MDPSTPIKSKPKTDTIPSTPELEEHQPYQTSGPWDSPSPKTAAWKQKKRIHDLRGLRQRARARRAEDTVPTSDAEEEELPLPPLIGKPFSPKDQAPPEPDATTMAYIESLRRRCKALEELLEVNNILVPADTPAVEYVRLPVTH
ncbi:hypothetical protein D9611_012834 [Ephemerocybe angulata]|uniref:Uncharacterized protein n=1 Tax=Ephemerocybe angulata TaxID=980116 RepID=A0A8H5BAN6_9AGAR|nr:hypothetical protein D9611_012834 [Tulosesus angulatus]